MRGVFTTAATLLLLPIVMGVQCGCGPSRPVRITTVPVSCVEGCASLDIIEVDGADFPVDVTGAPAVWCEYLWRAVDLSEEWFHAFRAIKQKSGMFRCSMPFGQTADLEYFYDRKGAQRVLSVNLTEPIREGAR